MNGNFARLASRAYPCSDRLHAGRISRDVDLAVRLGEGFSAPGLNYLRRLSELEGRLSGILGCKVDVIEEPVRKKRFQTEIDRDRAIAF